MRNVITAENIRYLREKVEKVSIESLLNLDIRIFSTNGKAIAFNGFYPTTLMPEKDNEILLVYIDFYKNHERQTMEGNISWIESGKEKMSICCFDRIYEIYYQHDEKLLK